MSRITTGEVNRYYTRYVQVRMAVFSPEYLASHADLDEADFTALIDEIVKLQAGGCDCDAH